MNSIELTLAVTFARWPLSFGLCHLNL